MKQDQGVQLDREFDSLILGAGMAGLAAARTLAEAGRRVAVLEAEPRIGGRILTRHTGSAPVELGAEFIHGRPPALLALIAEAGLTLYERTGEMLDASTPGATPRQEPQADEDSLFAPLEALKTFPGPDLSFADYAQRTGLSGEALEATLGYVEGFNAADAREASALALGRQQAAEDRIDGDLVFRLSEGYDRLPGFLAERVEAAGGALERNTRAEAISWQPGRVSVATSRGAFTARHLICTLPLGVLQSGALLFHPAPGAILRHAAHMRMGNVLRVTFVFRQRLWPEEMSFLFTRDRQPAVWWSAHPDPALTLTAWSGGPRADALLAMPEAALVTLCLHSLAQALALEPSAVREALLSHHLHPWHNDPSSLGAYSWVPVGGLDASAAMTEPVAGTLFFAGEHTDLSGHWGTVHAAYGSGLRAARQVLERQCLCRHGYPEPCYPREHQRNTCQSPKTC